MINGLIPEPNPPVDYFALTFELRKIANSISQIASRAAAYQTINAEKLEQHSPKLDKQISSIRDAVELPYKVTVKDLH